MRDEKTQAVTVRLDRDLHADAAAISKVTGKPFRELVERGLRREVEDRLQDGRLAHAVATVKGYGSTGGIEV
jgi:hypothetical protein